MNTFISHATAWVVPPPVQRKPNSGDPEGFLQVSGLNVVNGHGVLVFWAPKSDMIAFADDREGPFHGGQRGGLRCFFTKSNLGFQEVCRHPAIDRA